MFAVRPGHRGRRATRRPLALLPAPPATVSYARGVKKIITEILTLLWKVLRVVLWKWLRLFIGKIAFYGVLIVGVIALLVFVATRL